MLFLQRIVPLMTLLSVFLFVTCNQNELPCFNYYIPEIPITAVFQDTMTVGDTIEVTVHFRDSLLDINSGRMIDLRSVDIDNRINFTIGKLDTNILDKNAERFFLIDPINNSIVEQPATGFSHYYLAFSQGQNERSSKFRLILQYPGVFSVAFYMTTDLMEELDVYHLSDCNDLVENISYNTNNRSEENNYYLQEDSELFQIYESRLEWFNFEGIFAFVVE